MGNINLRPYHCNSNYCNMPYRGEDLLRLTTLDREQQDAIILHVSGLDGCRIRCYLHRCCINPVDHGRAGHECWGDNGINVKSIKCKYLLIRIVILEELTSMFLGNDSHPDRCSSRVGSSS